MLPSRLILNQFQFDPTLGQSEVLKLLDQFIGNRRDEKQVFLLKGFAGTGKTTIVSQLVKVLGNFDYDVRLLAPTGRAAKVIASYSGIPAHTIHRMIYMQTGEKEENFYSFRLKKNLLHNTIFIVDEASMLSDDPDTGERGLLNDLLRYVFERKTNKLMIVGDSAQLPPVGKELSPALDGDYLEGKFSVNLIQYEMKDVVRQEKESGILLNATSLREKIFSEKFSLRLKTKGYPDIYRMGGDRLEEGLRYAYDKYGTESTVIICRSNKSATLYNQYIRRTIRFAESEIEAGDFIMIVRNNYSILSEDSKAGFLANGDFAEVMKVVDFEEMYGFRFATLELRLLDVPEEENFEAKVFLDTLHSNEPQLSFNDFKKLQTEVLKDYEEIQSKKELFDKLRKDPYLNALQIKFAYSLTCHKSQGGQWSAVFVDQGFLKEESINKEFLRWLYTGITRATKELFLVNFAPQFFGQVEDQHND